eukprot:TRINITY_DN1538_c0_g1_i1.p2 TRINITY_DN1538_c0_g1~~TRINITY_DN1538_c0_g1_i1.p2  ORF type:complete len:336 (+),score=92.36 TRINITY_DN1538_c0_g1_i1:186-1193(+)
MMDLPLPRSSCSPQSFSGGSPRMTLPRPRSLSDRPLRMHPPVQRKVITMESYQSHYWPLMQAYIDYTLREPDGTKYRKDEMYHTAYQLCEQSHTLTLFHDLLGRISLYLEACCNELLELEDEPCFLFFAHFVPNYEKTRHRFCCTFRKLDRLLLRHSNSVPLDETLVARCLEIVFTREVREKMARILHAVHESGWGEPEVVCVLVKALYRLNKQLSYLCPPLFALYIPKFRRAGNLEEEAMHTAEFMQQWRQGENSGGWQQPAHTGEERPNGGVSDAHPLVFDEHRSMLVEPPSSLTSTSSSLPSSSSGFALGVDEDASYRASGRKRRYWQYTSA